VADFRGATVDAAKKAKLDYEILDTAQIRQRYPAFNVADGDEAYHDDVGGFVRPERCVTAQLQKAKALGADLHLNETVISFDQAGGSVTVKTDKGTYHTKELIVAAGSWLSDFLKPALAGQFKVTRQVLYWFQAKGAEEHAQFSPERFPVYIWQVPAPQPIYGFPATGGLEEGVKIATEQDRSVTTPDTVARAVSPDEIREMYETYVGPYFPGLSPTCVKHKVCLYTQVERARFIIDRHPDADRVIVASPCSGHGFKHSAGIGELLAQMALGEKHQDIARFAFGYAPQPA
jgi:sarcosine oxidase